MVGQEEVVEGGAQKATRAGGPRVGGGFEDVGDGMSGPGEAHDGGGMASGGGTRRRPRYGEEDVGMLAEEDVRVGAWLAAMQRAEDAGKLERREDGRWRGSMGRWPAHK